MSHDLIEKELIIEQKLIILPENYKKESIYNSWESELTHHFLDALAAMATVIVLSSFVGEKAAMKGNGRKISPPRSLTHTIIMMVPMPPS